MAADQGELGKLAGWQLRRWGSAEGWVRWGAQTAGGYRVTQSRLTILL